ncbi:MAG: glycosyltransferase [Chloroflexi bacterium]|nr:glycosyltransferase [Chloroflexota bacterium]
MGYRSAHLSIVVTSYSLERLHDLLDLLESLQAQTFRDFEVVFVGEKEAELCRSVAAYGTARGLRNVRTLFHQGPPGISAARDLGRRRARGEVIAFIDDDAVATRDWASRLLSRFSDPSVVGVTGPALPLWLDGGGSWFPAELLWIVGCTGWLEADGLRDVRNAWGMNMAFRREALTAADGFSEDIGSIHGNRLHGEEVELSLRVRKATGRRIVYDPSVRVLHRVPAKRLSAKWISKTSYWTGYTRSRLGRLAKEYGLKDDFLSVERRLLTRILRGLLPRTLAGFAGRPGRALRTLWTLALALSFVALGYSSEALSSLFHRALSVVTRKGG